MRSMSFADLQEFIAELERRGMLRRVRAEVDPELEIAEIASRVAKQGGPALLFERVRGSEFPVAVNLFGTWERVKLGLGAEPERVGEELAAMLRPRIPEGVGEKLASLRKLTRALSFKPRRVRRAPCQEVVLEGEEASLDALPVLKTWPKDAGRFITLPLVFTKSRRTGRVNVGMYRMQVYDARTTGMHWHVHKHGAEHLREAAEAGERLEVAVALGADPATVFSAVAPLPEGFDELSFAGFLRRKGVEVVRCRTVDLEVPAGAEFVLEGYVEPGETRVEGPFGDHTGYYTPPEEFPVFHLTCITRKEHPVYPATVVGKPWMEDVNLGRAVERMFLPLLRLQIPELVDMHMPPEAGFHNLAVVSIRKRYPGHAKKVMFALWGMGQMALTKIIAVVDHDVNVQDWREVLWAVSTRVDPARDLVVVRDAPADTLDHFSPLPNLGSKLGIDATVKWREEGFTREVPEALEMSREIRELVTKRWQEYGLQ